MAEASEQTAFLDPAALMEAGRRVADSTPEEPPTEPPQDSELFQTAYAARRALVWPTEPLTPVEYEALLQESLRMRAQLAEAEAERLDAIIDAEMNRRIAILQSFITAKEPAQPQQPAQPEEPAQPTTPQEDS